GRGRPGSRRQRRQHGRHPGHPRDAVRVEPLRRPTRSEPDPDPSGRGSRALVALVPELWLSARQSPEQFANSSECLRSAGHRPRAEPTPRQRALGGQMALSIGLFTYSNKPRGSVVCAAALAEALVELGHHAVLYALDKDRSGFYREVGCELRMMPARPAPDDPEALIRQRVAEVKDYVRRHDPYHDLIPAQDCLVASGILHAEPSLPLVRTVH